MAFNTELFRKIHEVIAPAPGVIAWDLFNMSTWEDGDNSCGTTRCVAGWAIHYATDGAPLYNPSGTGHSAAVVNLAIRLGAGRYNDDTVDLEDLGAKILGLEGSDRQLFYVDEERAVDFVLLAAQGREDEASEVLDR